jgi:general stress protein YciG
MLDYFYMAKKKNSAAVTLGRLGGKKKVAKGFSTMDPEMRAEAGRKGAAKRWAKKGTKKPAGS